MNTMKAAVYDHFGGPEAIRVADVQRPSPQENEVLIRVIASTVSSADHRARSRDLPAGLGIPSSFVLGIRKPRRPILGMDVAGVVAAIGTNVTRFSVGQEVIAMLGSSFGGHAEYAVVDASGAITAKPKDVTFAESAALVFGGITARAFLCQARIRRGGTSVLVNGASGAVGTAAVQLASLCGAHVTAVCSSRNVELLRTLGADRIVDYHTSDFARESHRYDVIFDCVGNAPFRRVGGILNPGGALLLVAATLFSIIRAAHDAHKHGVTVSTAPGPYRAADLEYVAALAAAGRLIAPIERTFGLDQIRSAHRLVDDGHKRGSVVLCLDEEGRCHS